jgi:ABC-type nitrate/sulfonate/bicarbonate transport system ATPase subunit
VIDLNDVTFGYPHQSPIFEGFNWEVARGETWAVLGPSGCGKTTLLYLLAGLNFPVSGRVRVDGNDLLRPRPLTGLILQDYGLLPWATVRQNAELGFDVRRFYGPDGKHAPTQMPSPGNATSWLERLGLADLADQYPHRLSGGQRQRTAIARTLALGPDLLLMDEPFSSLDAPTREGLQNLMLELWLEQKFTLIIVTHAIEEAACLGQKILVLGTPPHRETRVVSNPDLLQPNFRNTPTYQQLCRELRSRLN